MVAIGDDKCVIEAALAIRQTDLPAVVGKPAGRDDFGVEADSGAQTELVDIGFEVAGHLRMMRKVGEIPWHREIAEGAAIPRRIQAERAISSGAAIAEGPDPADPSRFLETLEGDSAVRKSLGGGKPAWSGADDAGFRFPRRVARPQSRIPFAIGFTERNASCRLSERCRKAGRCGVARRPLLRRRRAREHGQTGLALTRMNATKHGLSLRLLQAWLVPRWTRVSPARNNVSPSSMTA
jgi:hypothetical protein